MTENKNIKKIIRSRMTETGEKYMDARRHILGDNLYTITFISTAPSSAPFASRDNEGWKVPGVRASGSLYVSLHGIFLNTYGTHEAIDPQTGWTIIDDIEQNTLEEYFVRGGGRVPRSNYSKVGVKILIEVMPLVSPETLINLILPNTDKVIFHDIASEDYPKGENLERYLSLFTEEQKKKLDEKLLFSVLKGLDYKDLHESEIGLILSIPNDDTLTSKTPTNGERRGVPYPAEYENASEFIRKTWLKRI